MDFSIEPTLSIEEATQLAEKSHEDLLEYTRDGKAYRVHRDDLEKMAAMGLADLPVESIAVPQDSPLLYERTRLSATLDYSRRLSEFFPVYFVAALYELQSLLQRFEAKAYVIGGITRDMLLFHEKKLQVRDVDITLEGNALDLAEFLSENSRNFQVLERYPEFGTAKVQYKDSLVFDLASTRREIYAHCGALPLVVERGVPLINDVSRRDFTVNALAFSVHALGHVLDYANGIQDIKTRVLRVLHPVSFFEDPSRILRAMKFCARFNFSLSEETRLLLERFFQYAAKCYKGGGERIKQELKAFFCAEESPVKSGWVRFFMQSGCYRLLNMESGYQPSEEAFSRIERLSETLPIIQEALTQYTDRDFLFDVYLCFLCRDMDGEDFQSTAKRLGLTRNEREFVEQFRKHYETLSAQLAELREFSPPSEIYDMFHHWHFITIVAVMAELGQRDEKRMKTCLEAFVKYKRKWENLKLELDGNDLIELGVPEGREIGQLLNELLHVKLTGRLPDRLSEIQYVKNLLRERMPEEAPEEVLSHELSAE